MKKRGMEKMKRVLIIFLLLFPLLFVQASAQEQESDYEEYYQGQLDSSGAKELISTLPDDTRELLEELGMEDLDYSEIVNFDPKRLLSLLTDIISGEMASPLKAGGAALGIIILCAVLEGFKSAGTGKTLDGVYGLVATLCVGTVIVLPVLRCMSDVCAAIQLSGGFMLSFIPILAALIAASGSPASAYAYNTIVFTVAELISRFSSTVLMPFVGIYMGINIASGVSPQINLSGVGDTIKKSVTVVLTFCSTIFVGLLSVQSIVTSAADTVTLKTAKFLTGNFVPVVGSVLGDTLATVQGCVGLVKGTVGAFGLIALAIIYIPVILETACWMLIINLCSICSDVMDLKNITRLLKGINAALGILIAILIFCGVLLIISTAIMVKIRTA